MREIPASRASVLTSQAAPVGICPGQQPVDGRADARSIGRSTIGPDYDPTTVTATGLGYLLP